MIENRNGEKIIKKKKKKEILASPNIVEIICVNILAKLSKALEEAKSTN